MKKKVLIVQRALPQYRKDFFNQLHKKFKDSNVELTLVYGKFKSQDALKKDEVDLDWATYLPNTTFQVGQTEMVWQPILPYLADKNLVIVEQANRNLINYYLLARRLFSGKKFAFWGHGRNMQTSETDTRNKFKKFYINKCDWWFAYTDRVKKELVAGGFPEDKITCVQNAIDTKSLTHHYEGITPIETANLKKNLGISSSHVGIYCGGIYKEKRIDFLISACDQIRGVVPDFHFIVIGSGPDAYLVEEAAQTRPWIHYIGPKFGLDRVIYFKISSLFLMPGLVGLAILDSFAMRTPMLTTHFPFHSPEIEYLQNSVNGIITENNLESYVRAVVTLLQDEPKRKQLVASCETSSERYTVEQMVNNFSEGVIRAVNA